MKNLLILAGLLVSLSLNAQTLKYQLQVDMGDFVLPGNIANTADGGLVTCGTAATGSNGDAYIIKLSNTGSIQWKKTYGTPALVEGGRFVLQTSDGGYLMAGTIRVTNQNEDIFVVRTDANGDTLWTRSYGNGSNDYGNSVIELPSGNFIIAGSCVINSTKAGVLRLDPSGNLLSANFSTAVYASPNMRAELTGPNELTFTGTFATEIRTDTTGVFTGMANIQLGGSGNTFDAILSTAQAHISVGNMDIGGGAKIVITHSDSIGSTNNLWVTKYSTSGFELTASSLMEANDLGLVVAGHATSFTSAPGGLVLMKTDSSGNPLWAKKYAPAGGTEYSSGGGIKTSDGGFALCGYVFLGSVADLVIIKTDSAGFSGCNETALVLSPTTAAYFAPPQLGTFPGTFVNNGTWINAITATAGTSLVICTSVNGVNELNLESGAYISPNPFTDKLFLNLKNPHADEKLDWKITDLNGKTVFATSNYSFENVAVPELAPGIYLVEVRNAQGILVREKMIGGRSN